MSLNIQHVKAAAENQWPMMLVDLAGLDDSQVSVNAGKIGTACPNCGGTNRYSFKDALNGDWACRHCGGGDGFELLQRVTGHTLPDVIKQVSGYLGLSPDVKADLATLEKQKQEAAARRQQEADKAKAKAEKGLNNTLKKWEGLKECRGNEYSDHKRFSEALKHSIRQIGNCISVPVYNASGALISLQNYPGTKDDKGRFNRYFAKDTTSKGGFHKWGRESYYILIGESISTTDAAYQLADSSRLAVCAFSASQLPDVAAMIREQYPESQIVILVDRDTAGLKYAKQAVQQVIGCQAVLPPMGNDWSDYYLTGGKTSPLEVEPLEVEQVEKPCVDLSVEDSPAEETQPENDQLPDVQLPKGFKINDGLVWLEQIGKDGEMKSPMPVCSELRVLAKTRNVDGLGWGRLLQWTDDDGTIRRWAMPMSMVSGDGTELRKTIQDAGLSFIGTSAKARQAFLNYIQLSQPERRVVCTDKTGWHSGAYVLPDEVIGRDSDEVILQTSAYGQNDYHQQGTLEDWQKVVSILCTGNSRLVFAVSTAFAAPMARHLGLDGGGFHFRGGSSLGKSTTIKAAASVCGSPRFIQTWRATDNGLEGTAANRNDALLCLDELGQVDPSKAGDVSYMLANGQGKRRAGKDGEARAIKEWRLLYLSTGEISLAAHMETAGKKAKAGQEVRQADIPADTGKYGSFENIHSFPDGGSFADHVVESASTYFGTAFRAFIQAVSEDLNGSITKAKATFNRFISEVAAGTETQVRRVACRFAMVAAGGELATEYGVTGWDTGEAYTSAETCFNAWLSQRGHSGNQEDIEALEQVRAFFTANQMSRFSDWNGDRPISNMVGFRRIERTGTDLEQTQFYVLPSGWKEITKGFDSVNVALLCAEKGWIQRPSNTATLQHNSRLPGIGQKKHYLINDKVIA